MEIVETVCKEHTSQLSTEEKGTVEILSIALVCWCSDSLCPLITRYFLESQLLCSQKLNSEHLQYSPTYQSVKSCCTCMSVNETRLDLVLAVNVHVHVVIVNTVM